MADIRKPTTKESAKLERSREMMRKGIEGEKDMLSKISPTMAKSARDDIRMATQMRESVPESAREYEAYQGAGYKKGGFLAATKKGGYVKAADGIAQRGKTRGTMVACGGGYMKGKK